MYFFILNQYSCDSHLHVLCDDTGDILSTYAVTFNAIESKSDLTDSWNMFLVEKVL